MGLRRFIEIVKESRLTDGVWTSVSSRELKTLAEKHDLRGIGSGNKAYLFSAYDDYHYNMRKRLGILPYSLGFGPEGDEDGFNFYAAPVSEMKSHYDDDGREDWMFNPPSFTVNGIGVWLDCDAKTALMNQQFARMVGHKNVQEKPAG